MKKLIKNPSQEEKVFKKMSNIFKNFENISEKSVKFADDITYPNFYTTSSLLLNNNYSYKAKQIFIDNFSNLRWEIKKYVEDKFEFYVIFLVYDLSNEIINHTNDIRYLIGIVHDSNGVKYCIGYSKVEVAISEDFNRYFSFQNWKNEKYNYYAHVVLNKNKNGYFLYGNKLTFSINKFSDVPFSLDFYWILHFFRINLMYMSYHYDQKDHNITSTKLSESKFLSKT